MSTQIKAFDKTNLLDLRRAIDQALATVSAEFGLQSLKIKNISFDETSFRTQMEGKVNISDNPKLVEQKNSTNKELSRLLGYSHNIVGLEFKQDDRTMRVTDIDINRSKYPIKVVDVATQKGYKFTAKVQFKFINAPADMVWDKEAAAIFSL